MLGCSYLSVYGTCRPVDLSTCHPINEDERIVHACKTWIIIGMDVGKCQWSRH